VYKAIWNDCEIACGADVIEVEKQLYFLADDTRLDLLRDAPERSRCEWKGGEAEYLDIVVDGKINRAAAWTYPQVGPAARDLAGRIAFWRGVDVAWSGDARQVAPRTLQPSIPNVAKALGATVVVWRPDLPAAFRTFAAGHTFAGYLIPDLQVLVDILATPTEDERRHRIGAARKFAGALLAWNQAHPSGQYGYVAVWGSATPASSIVAALRDRHVVLALGEPPEIISRIAAPSDSR
jgi:uncharacterized protein (DUF427 family)